MKIDLTGISEQLHGDICRAICPCCEYGLPETRRSDANEWWHSLPRTKFEMPCRANDYRNIRAQQVNAAPTS